MKTMVIRPLVMATTTVAVLAAAVPAADALPQLRVREIASPATVTTNGKTVAATFRYSRVTEYTSAFVSASQSRGSDGYGGGSASASPIRCDGTVRRLKVDIPISTGIVKPGHVDIQVSMSGFLGDEIISSSLGETIDVVRRQLRLERRRRTMCAGGP